MRGPSDAIAFSLQPTVICSFRTLCLHSSIQVHLPAAEQGFPHFFENRTKSHILVEVSGYRPEDLLAHNADKLSVSVIAGCKRRRGRQAREVLPLPMRRPKEKPTT